MTLARKLKGINSTSGREEVGELMKRDEKEKEEEQELTTVSPV